MRSVAFNLAYWILSIGYGLAAAFAALAPGRGPTTWVIRRYVRRMVQAMRLFAGIRIEVRGRERLPAGAFFEIRDGKVARISNTYNLNDWIAQVGA